MTQQLRNRRFETRLDAATDDLITDAAQTLGESRSTFVVRAARDAAQKVVTTSDHVTKAEALAILLDGMDEASLRACPLIQLLRA